MHQNKLDLVLRVIPMAPKTAAELALAKKYELLRQKKVGSNPPDVELLAC